MDAVIPKRIISMWIGGEMPQMVKECVATHKLDGYEHLWIDNSNYHEYDCKYLDECIKAERWGKASDYIRMAALERHGGIYLDADIAVIKPFDDLLDVPLFVCEEKNYFVANSVIGAVAGHPLIQHYLGTLQRNFRGDGELVFQPGMGLWTELIKQGPWVNHIKIYPAEYFFPYDHQSGETHITPNSYTIHYYLKSWKV
jgi:mannosyltransferase OCH1-like enzyme